MKPLKLFSCPHPWKFFTLPWQSLEMRQHKSPFCLVPTCASLLSIMWHRDFQGLQGLQRLAKACKGLQGLYPFDRIVDIISVPHWSPHLVLPCCQWHPNQGRGASVRRGSRGRGNGPWDRPGNQLNAGQKKRCGSHGRDNNS